MSSTAENTNF